MIKITRAVCLTVWFKISVLAKTQSILSHLAAHYCLEGESVLPIAYQPTRRS